jgi:AAA domain/UvrD-like helicase C-terminal domain
MGFTPTEEQQAIVDAAATGKPFRVSAAAGTGKTATLLQVAQTRPRERFLYLAFNAAIKQEASGKFGRNVRCYTTHGLALAANRPEWQAKMDRKIGRMPGREIARKCDISRGYKSETVDLTSADFGSLAWSMVGRYCDSADPVISWRHLTASMLPEVEIEERQYIGSIIAGYAERIWRNLQREAPMFAFGHPHYRKIWALSDPQLDYDRVLFDEAQDAAEVVLGVLLAQRNTQIIPVGDRNQAINEFTGAIDSIDKFPGIEYVLTQSFRFGPAIAEVANWFLEDLDTSMRVKGFDKIRSTVGPCANPTAILARTNAGAMTEVFRQLDLGRRVALQGDGHEIKSLANAALMLQAGLRCDHKDLRGFATWGDVQEYVEHESAGADLKAFVRLVDTEGADRILSALEGLVPTKTKPWGNGKTQRPAQPVVKADVTVSTAHKAKGLEFERVLTCDDFPSPKPSEVGNTTQPMAAGELRLAYVTATRATQRLDPTGVLSVLGN